MKDKKINAYLDLFRNYITAAGQLTEFPTDDMLDDSWTYYGDWFVTLLSSPLLSLLQ